jgi:hypothetical protein
MALKIYNLDFNDAETVILYTLAGSTLQRSGMSLEQVREYVSTLTPQNIVRLALGPEFSVRKRGGARPNTGRRNPQKKKATRKPKSRAA